jgi:type IV pilus assembly protein PilE
MPQRIISHKGRLTGFTLIELMIVVVIASILIAIAVPSYIDKVRKSRRTEAKTALLDLAGREERFYNTGSPPAYSALLSDLGYGVAGPTTNVGSGYYQVTISLACTGGAVAPCYTLTAVPITADQLKDVTCLFFTLTNTGAQTATNPSCWR